MSSPQHLSHLLQKAAEAQKKQGNHAKAAGLSVAAVATALLGFLRR